MKKFFKQSWLIIVVCLVITVILGVQLVGVSIENTVRRYMPKNNASYKKLIQTEEQFGSMCSIGISFETGGETILTPEYVKIIRDITEQVKDLDGVKSVDSLADIDYVCSLDGGLAAGNIYDEDTYTGSAADMEEIKTKLNDWQEMYNRVVISDNFKAAQMAATIDPSMRSRDTIALLHKIQKITKDAIKGSDLEVRYYGDPVLSDNATNFMLHDLVTLIPLVIVVVLLSLYFSFKTVSGTLLPLITVLLATIWSCGIMSALHFTFTIVASVIPVALIACGSAYGIHVINHYNAALAKIEGEITKEKHLDAIIYGLKDVWIAVLLAGITTIAGFISLVSSPIEPLRSFAIFSALGIFFALILSVTFLPAMLYIIPLKFVKKNAEKERNALDVEGKRTKSSTGALMAVFNFCAGSRRKLVIFGTIIIVFSVLGVSRLVVDTSLVNYFPSTSKFRKDIAYVDETFAGTNTVYFVISGQEKGDLTKPEILKAVDSLQENISEKYPDRVGKAVSFTTFIKRMNQVMHVPTPMIAEASYDSAVDNTENSGDFDSFDSFDDFSSNDFDSFDDTSFDSFDESTSSAVATTETDFVDPNDAYVERLSKNMTTEEALELFHKAYIEAGGKKAKIDDLVTALEKEVNYNGLAYYEVPYDTSKYPVATRDQLSDLVSQYLLLYSGALDRFSDDQLAPKSIRMQVQLRTHGTQETQEVIDYAKDFATKYFPAGYTIEATGNGEMECSMTKMVISSQLLGIGLSILMVFVIISVAFKSPIAGLIGIIPLAFTIIINFMIMGFFGIHLDLVTSIIASVGIGVGIDYTIHFLEGYKAERAKSNDLAEVTKNTFAVAGHGIITNAIAVGFGFLVLVLSKFIILVYIGILAMVIMFSSSTLAMIVIPGILNAVDPKFIRPKDEAKMSPPFLDHR